MTVRPQPAGSGLDMRARGGIQLAGPTTPTGPTVDLSGVTTLDGFGHSISFGTGATDPATTGFVAQVADGLGLDPEIYAIAGTRLLNGGVAEDGWGKVMADCQAVRAANAAPYARLPRAGLGMWGINDVATWGPTAYQEPFRHALLHSIGYYLASKIREDSDASVVATGYSSSATDPGQASGGSKILELFGNDPITVNAAADTPASRLLFGVQCQTDAITADWTASGGATGAVNGHFASLALQSFLLRSDPVAAGAHAVTLTPSNVALAPVFDWWGIEPELSHPFIVVGQYKLPDYSPVAFQGYEPNDADIDALNVILAEVAAEFGPQVIYIDTEAAIAKNPAKLVDGLHPNQLGHDALAALVLADPRLA